MILKSSEVKHLQDVFDGQGNSFLILTGQPNCGKEELLKEFTRDKKSFYYRCRQADPAEQKALIGRQISKQFDVKLLKDTYDEYFTRLKSNDGSKLVFIIDEVQYLMKKDADFIKSIARLKQRQLYPGPIMIVFATSDLVWAGQGMKDNLGEYARRVDKVIRIEDLNFLEVVRSFPDASVSDCIKIYGVLGGIPGYLNRWDTNEDFKTNICRLVLSEDGYLFHEAQGLIAHELRELYVYNTILSYIAQGNNKLNDLYQKTGFSRAKISVYMKNLANFDIIEKLVSFETGGWENAKKGVYQIKNTFINFWFKFVYQHLSDLYWMEAETFYGTYIEKELDAYLNRYFRNVCMEYLMLLNQLGRTPFAIHKMGTWVGKTGNIDIIAQSTDRQNIIGLCNWEQEELTVEMCDDLADSMEKAKITSKHFYLFSAKSFAADLMAYAADDPRFTLIDMNEL